MISIFVLYWFRREEYSFAVVFYLVGFNVIDVLDVKQERILGTNKRITILNTTIDVLNVQETIELVEEYVRKKEPLHLMGVNADKINLLNRNELLKRIVNSCGIINADGVSVVWASRFLGMSLPERVAGIDLMQNLIDLSEKKGYSVYFLGARQEIVEKTVDVVKNLYPQLVIAGFRNGYFNRSEWQDISNELLIKKPDFVFVGITSPMKEYLIEFIQNNGCKSVFMGVGGSFDVISGAIRRAPVWLQNIGMEWLYRVIQEPRRLFKRYLFGNLTFMKSVWREKKNLK